MRIILSGAAPLASHIESFLRVVACCHVLQGYGNVLDLKELRLGKKYIFSYELLPWCRSN